MNVPLASFHSEEDRLVFEEVYRETLKKWPVPFEVANVKTSFGVSRVLICGKRKNPPLVLLHGLLNTALMWQYNIADLSRHYRVYLLERLGDAGLSRHQQVAIFTDHWSHWLSEIFDGLHLSKSRLVGFSLGGWHSAQFALKYPDRVHSLALLSPVPLFKKIPYHVIRDSLASTMKGDRPNMRRLIAKQYSPQFYPDRVYEKMQYATIACFTPSVPIYPREFHRDEWARLPQKTMVVLGEEEIYYNPIEAKDLLNRVRPDIALTFLSDTGHSVSIERAKVVDKLLLDFFKPSRSEKGQHLLGWLFRGRKRVKGEEE